MVCMTILSCFVLNEAKSQISSLFLEGKIVDAKTNQPVEFATVVLYRLPDSVMVKNEFSNENGAFSFQQLDTANYRVKVLMLGYEDYETNLIVVGGEVLDPILLKINSADAMLNEVEVVYKKEFVERKIDRTIINVDGLISNAGNSALEVLKKSPGVLVGSDGNIQLNGKSGVLVLIDNKPSYLSGPQLENYLEALPSANLDKIEIMTNPPAQYEAAGNGVINIKTKKNRADGFNGSLTIAPRRSRYNQFNSSLNFNYKKNRFNFFGNISGGYRKRFTETTITRSFKNEDNSPRSVTDLFTDNVGSGKLFRGNVGLDYQYSKQSTWGILVTGLKWDGVEEDKSLGELFNDNMELDSMVNADNATKIELDNLGVNLNYKYTFDKKKQSIRLDADIVQYLSEDDQSYANTFSFPGVTNTYDDLLAGLSESQIRIYASSLDYSNKINQYWSISSGLKGSYIETDNLTDYFYTFNNVTNPDYERSNHFIYEETIAAAYANVSADFDRLAIQGGLRFENTLSKGLQLGNPIKPEEDFTNDYQSLFPTIYVKYNLDSLSNHVLAFNYGKRIERPFYRELNPIITQLDRYTFQEGNPYLLAAFAHNLELSYTFRNKITSTLSYSNTDDQVEETFEIVDGIYYSRPGNIGQTILKSFSINANIDLTKWCSLNAYTALTNIQSKSELYGGQLDVSGNYLRANSTFQFRLPKKWSAELAGFYISKVQEVQSTNDSYWSINSSIRKKISPRSSITFTVSDIFHTIRNNGIIGNLNQVDANYKQIRDTRRFTLAFNYRFGRTMAGLRRSYRTTSDSEKRRAN